jgi:F-type H+-transporting ATPase subunit b
MHFLHAFVLLAEESSSTSRFAISPVWKWLNFAMLVGFLGYLISKHVGPILANRAKQIEEGLAAGEKAKAEADARAAAVQTKLADLGGEIARMRAEAKVELDREAERLKQDSEREVARIQQHASQEIESAGKVARLEVQRFAAKTAIELAERKVRARMSPEVESALLGAFLDGLANGHGRHADNGPARD